MNYNHKSFHFIFRNAHVCARVVPHRVHLIVLCLPTCFIYLRVMRSVEMIILRCRWIGRRTCLFTLSTPTKDGPTRAPTFALQAEVLVAFVGVGNVSKRVRATECKKAV